MSMSAIEKRFREELPEALVLLRKARGWSQGELAEKMGVSQPILCRFERGHRTPTSVSLSQHLRALQADWGDLNKALKEVRRAKGMEGEPSPQALTLGDGTSKDDLLVAYLAAAEDGRGDEFVDRALEQARYLVQLRERVKKRRSDEDEAAADEDSPSAHGLAAAAGGEGS